MTKVAELLNEALKLDERDRAELAERLLRSIDGGVDDATQEEIDAAWAKEIERRSDLVHSGECQLIDFEEGMAEIRKRLAQRRSS